MAFKVLKLNEIANGMTEPKRTLRLKVQEYKKKKKKKQASDTEKEHWKPRECSTLEAKWRKHIKEERVNASEHCWGVK